MSTERSLAFDFTIVNVLLEVLWLLSVNGAAEGDAGSEDLLAGTVEGDGHGLVGLSHGLGDSEDVVELNIAGMSHILGLFSISAWLLEGLDDEWGSRWQDLNFALSILDSDFNLDFHSLPLGSGLLDVFTNLLGWHTDWTALWREGSSTSYFTTNNFHVH